MGGNPFLAQLMCVAFNFPPKGWALCNGQILAINQNQALFALLGTTFGGNGSTTFALPNLQGRASVMQGQGIAMGQSAGESAHTLISSEMPQHTHILQGVSPAANQPDGTGNLLATTSGAPLATYNSTAGNLTATFPGNIGNAGGSQPHDNMSPYLTMNWVIALVGIFPSRN